MPQAHSGLLLFAHGARDPRWALPFERIRDRISTMHPQLPVVLAFLEFMTPTLPEAADALVERGCGHIHVLPLFLGAGGHVRKDLPALLDDLRARHQGLTVSLHPAIGEMEAVIEAMALAASAAALANQSPTATSQGKAVAPASGSP